MQAECVPADEPTPGLPRRTALKAGGALLTFLTFGRFTGLAEAKAAGGSGLVGAEDYGVGGIFDDFVTFRFVEALTEPVRIDGRDEYPDTIEYWPGCESVGETDRAKKTFQGDLIEDDTGDNQQGGNQAVMYVYEKRPVSWDWHKFVEDEACGEDYVKVGYEPAEEGSAPEDPGNRPPDKGGDGDDGDHEDASTADDDWSSGAGGSGGGSGGDGGNGQSDGDRGHQFRQF